MQWIHYVPKIVKISSNVIFASLLLFWAYLALCKYTDEPISTFISYTKGDDNENIEFPHMTFCTITGIGKEFLDDILHYLNNNASLKIDEYLSSHSPNITYFFLNGFFTYQRGQRVLEIPMDSFYPILSVEWGPCIGFDMENLDIAIPVNDGLNSASSTVLSMTLNFSAFKSDYVNVAFHSKYDVTDAFDTNPALFINTNNINEINLKKRVVQTEPTKNLPCDEIDMKACFDIEGTKKVVQSLGCKVPFIYTGKHLEKYINGYKDLPACKKEFLQEALELFWSDIPEKEHCKYSRACRSTKYNFQSHVYDQQNNHTVFYVTFSTFEVEHYNTYISYDALSLIAELGGLLGMTLGLSFASVGDVLANIIERGIQL